MSSRPSRKGELYIRRLRPSDKASSFVTRIRLAFYGQLLRKNIRSKAFVLLRHGHSNVMEVAASRAELAASLYGSGGRTFKQMARAWRDSK